MSPLKTEVTKLPESRVRVAAEVPADEVERRVQQAAKQLGRQLRIPGFRKGKVPPTVVIRRLLATYLVFRGCGSVSTDLAGSPCSASAADLRAHHLPLHQPCST